MIRLALNYFVVYNPATIILGSSMAALILRKNNTASPIGLSKIPCIPKIADCGGLMIGVPIRDPKTPPLLTVKVPPSISSTSIAPLFAFSPRAAIYLNVYFGSCYSYRYVYIISVDNFIAFYYSIDNWLIFNALKTSFKRWAIRNRIRFILTRYSVLVPPISLVGSAGGILTVAAGAAAGGAALGGGGGGGDCCACGGGGGAETGVATAAAAGVSGSAALGVSSTLGAALAGAGAPSNNLLKHNICDFNYKKLSLPVMVIVHKSCPALTVAPSSTSRFSIIPLTGEGTGTDTYCAQLLQARLVKFHFCI
ncbi:hypothetical protein AGLY_014616 [Aphis glycines]|uniref:Uncharacterized protein n=1 Tax=Aphis glycines TaxID=307491 RepID=A0A6G0T1Q0_APHGL|nr:hypothetical protein AGLY_014616 [Aphis glycines]